MAPHDTRSIKQSIKRNKHTLTHTHMPTRTHLEKHLQVVLLVSQGTALEYHVLAHPVLRLRDKLLLAPLEVRQDLLKLLTSHAHKRGTKQKREPLRAKVASSLAIDYCMYVTPAGVSDT